MSNFLKKLNSEPDIYYIPFPKKSDKVYLDIFLREGSVHDKHLGLTHLLEHYLVSEFQEISGFKIKNNGGVGFEDSNFYIESTKKGIVKDSAIFLKNILGRESFKNKKILEKEKLTIFNEFQNYRNDSEEKIKNIFKKEVLEKKCSYIKNRKKEHESIKNLKLKDLKERYNSLFTNQKIIISIGGFRLNKEILDKLVSRINKIKIPDSQNPEYRTCKLKSAQFKKVNTSNIEGVYSSLMFPGVSLEDSLGDRMLANMTCKFLTDSSNVDIFKKIRDVGVYSLNYNNYFYKKFGLINLYTNTNKQNTREFLKIVLEGIDKIKTKGLNKNILKTGIINSLENNEEEWGENLGRYEWITDDLICNNKIYSLKECNDFIKSIDNKKIKEFTRKYFDLDFMSLVLAGNKKEIENIDINFHNLI